MAVTRKAGTQDIPIIRELARATWPIAYKAILSANQLAYMLQLIYSEDALSTQINKWGHQFLLAEENGAPVGFASYSVKSILEPGTYRLHKLYVLPQQQGKGTGKLLLDQIIKETRHAGAGSLELNVNRHNPALDFYKRHGFTIVKEADIDIGEGYFMNDYIMEKKL